VGEILTFTTIVCHQRWTVTYNLNTSLQFTHQLQITFGTGLFYRTIRGLFYRTIRSS